MRDGTVNSAVDLLIFDCDGVLVDSEILSMRAYKEVLSKSGVSVDDALWAQCIGLKQADIFTKIEHECGRLIGEETRALLWPRIQELFRAELQRTPGLSAFLDAWRGQSCIASSSAPERIALSLEVTGLAEYFGERVYSTQLVKRGKPAPDIFLYAADKAGIDPAQSVVIEDSPFGVCGARAAGMRAIGYVGGAHAGPDHGGKLLAAGALFVAKDWREIGEWFANDRLLH